MKITSLPNDPGPAGWNELLPTPNAPQILEENITADWLVIGAGFAGMAAAQRIKQLDPTGRIVMLEATRIAAGPAGRNSGFMIDLPHDLSSTDYAGDLSNDRHQIETNRHAINFAADMAHQYDMPPDAFSISGKINGAASTRGHKHNQDYARHLNNLNEPYELFDAQQMRDITGTDYYQSGLYTPGCAMIQPALFIRSIAKGLRDSGVVIYENSPVISLTHSSTWRAKTHKGSVSAPKVILAVNGHLESFGFYPSHLMHIFTYAAVTRALSKEKAARLGGQDVWGITPADPMGTTVRKISSDDGTRIVVRNKFTFEANKSISQKRLSKTHEGLVKSFHRRFKMLDGVDMQYHWAGRLCLSYNSVEIISKLKPGLYAACCQNGLGTAKGTFGGKMAAELACGESSPLLEQTLQTPEPKKIIPQKILRPFANTYLKFQEFKAGREI